MKKLIGFISIVTMLCPSATLYAADIIQSFSSYNSGFSTNNSVSYKNDAVLGYLVNDYSSPNYRNYSGFAPARTEAPVVSVIDNNMSFVDESPTSSEVQTTCQVTFKVTLQISGGNLISTACYKISNSGIDALTDPALPTRYDVVIDSVIIPNKKIRYKVNFPTLAGQTLSVSENNYIQWFAKNDAGADAPPAIYRIRVRAGVAPTIAITQPDTKGGYASVQPLIKATITDPDTVVDSTTVRIRLIKADGTRPADIDILSSNMPNIYSASANLVTYKYEGSPLVADAVYNLTVSVNDKNGASYASAISVTVKGGAIADLIPYPSPFDPKVQPVIIRYILNKRADVTVTIYDMSGRVVKTVVSNETRDAGISEAQWAGDNYAGEGLANGVYFCEIVAKDDDGEHRRYSSVAIFGK
jgi:hypothetical protein